MAQSVENKILSIEDILEILNSQVESMPPSPTSSRYQKALSSFSSSSSRIVDNAYTAPRANTASADTAQSADTAKPILREAPILRTSLTDWLVSLWLGATPYTTASLYLDIISSLYGSAVKAGRLPKTTLFSEIKQQLKALGPEGWKSGIDDTIFTNALRLTKNASRLIADDAIATDLILLSLTSGLRPLTEIALLRRDSSALSAPPSPLRDIMARHTGSARRKYIFPLRQSERTEASLRKHIAKICNALFRRARLPQSTDPNRTVEALWAYAALRAGVPASAIVTHLGHAPLGLPVLKLSVDKTNCVAMERPASGRRPESDNCVAMERPASGPRPESDNCVAMERPASGRRPESSDEDNSSLIINNLSLEEVGKIFLDNPPRWYALSLRPGVRFTRLCRRIQLLTHPHTASADTARSADTAKPILPKADTAQSAIQLFYPCEEITRAIGKKIVVRERPFIRSVVFFKAKLTDIGPLLSKIGDLAWCYRQNAAPGAPYAEISDAQFHLFQQTIARFTPDYEVAPSCELELKPNDRVEILGGLFAGHEATFVKSEESGVKSEESNIVYRLNIVGDNGIEWRIGVDSRLANQK